MQCDTEGRSISMCFSFIQKILTPKLFNSPHLFIPYQNKEQRTKLRTITVQFLKFLSAQLLGLLAPWSALCPRHFASMSLNTRESLQPELGPHPPWPPFGLLQTKGGSAEWDKTHPVHFEIPQDRCFMNTRHYYYPLCCCLSWQSQSRLNICSSSVLSQMHFYSFKLLPINFLLIFLIIPGLFI